MAVLKSLSFAPLAKASSDPISARRIKFVQKLEEQKLLLENPDYIRTTQRMAEIEGTKQVVTRQQRVRPWWRNEASGGLLMSIKFGSRPVEFEKGKAAVVVPSKDKLPAVIDTLISAIRAGELDDALAQAAKNAPPIKPKRPS